MLIIGSHALIQHFPNLRTPKDLDIIATPEEVDEWFKLQVSNKQSHVFDVTVLSLDHLLIKSPNTGNIEIFLAKDKNTNWEYLNYTKSEGVLENIPYAPIEVLFSLKKSHIYFSINHHKNVLDYNIIRKSLNGIDTLSEITERRFKETEERVGRLKTPKLSKSKDAFFKQSESFVKSYFIHDEMHVIMSHGERPTYELMQYENQGSVLCSKDLWDGMSYLQQIHCVLEESYVIALERKILPMMYGAGRHYTPNDAFRWALMRVCTNLCSGWFREFAIENFTEILNNYNQRYVIKFLEAVKEERIIPIELKTV